MPGTGATLSRHQVVKISVRIEDLYSERVWLLEGSARQVELQVLLIWPWLRSPNPVDRGNVQALLEDLGNQQAFKVEVVSS